MNSNHSIAAYFQTKTPQVFLFQQRKNHLNLLHMKHYHSNRLDS